MYDIDDRKEKKMAVMRASVGSISIIFLTIMIYCMFIDTPFFRSLHVKITFGVIAACCTAVIVMVITSDNSTWFSSGVLARIIWFSQHCHGVLATLEETGRSEWKRGWEIINVIQSLVAIQHVWGDVDLDVNGCIRGHCVIFAETRPILFLASE